MNVCDRNNKRQSQSEQGGPACPYGLRSKDFFDKIRHALTLFMSGPRRCHRRDLRKMRQSMPLGLGIYVESLAPQELNAFLSYPEDPPTRMVQSVAFSNDVSIGHAIIQDSSNLLFPEFRRTDGLRCREFPVPYNKTGNEPLELFIRYDPVRLIGGDSEHGDGNIGFQISLPVLFSCHRFRKAHLACSVSSLGMNSIRRPYISATYLTPILPVMPGLGAVCKVNFGPCPEKRVHHILHQ